MCSRNRSRFVFRSQKIHLKGLIKVPIFNSIWVSGPISRHGGEVTGVSSKIFKMMRSSSRCQRNFFRKILHRVTPQISGPPGLMAAFHISSKALGVGVGFLLSSSSLFFRGFAGECKTTPFSQFVDGSKLALILKPNCRLHLIVRWFVGCRSLNVPSEKRVRRDRPANQKSLQFVALFSL